MFVMLQRRSVGAGSFLMRIGSWASVLLAVSTFGSARGQAPPPPTETAPPPLTGAGSTSTPPPPKAKTEAKSKAGSSAPRQVGDLTTRFRFIERYTSADQKASPTDIGLYRVGARAGHRLVDERPQGAPERTETTIQIIYAERPAVVDSSGVVTDMVRRYDALRVSHSLEKKPSESKPLDGLTIWYKTRPGTFPFVMSLTDGRTLSEQDYEYTAHLLFLPDLSAVLPSVPTRVDDRWRLSRDAQKVLFGHMPIKAGTVFATLQDVQKSPKGSGYAAVIAVAGKAQLPPNGAEYTLNAQVVFSFPALPPPPAATGGSTSDVVEVLGAITSLRLATTSTGFVPGSNKRLLRTHTNELSVERQTEPIGTPALTVPAAPPAPTKENSWLTYEDPDGRFHFRHPQEYLPNKQAAAEDENPDAVILMDSPGSRIPESQIRAELIPKTGNAEADRNNRDPDFYVKQLKETWAEARFEVIQGPTGWLPEATWRPFNMKVFRIEAALKVSGSGARGETRVFYDRFIVQFTRNECLVVTATTPRDPPIAFRKEVEEILKSFKLEPAKKAGGT